MRHGRWRRWVSPQERADRLEMIAVWLVLAAVLWFGIGYLLKVFGVIR